MATPTLDRATILKAIRGWPPDEQLALAQEIFRRADAPVVEEPLVPPDSRGLAGILAAGQAPPTDEDVTRWLDERRIGKYDR